MTTPTNSIQEISVKNYMRVRTAKLTVDGNTLVVSGDNEAGKSSFVQAIEDIFGGTKSAPAMPIRKGATEATVMVRVCSDGKRLKAELTHTKGGRRLVVRDEDDKAQTSPQSIMDRFWAETSFDPSIFLISKPAEQTVMLKKLAGLDFTKIDAERLEKFTLRTSVNREVERLKTAAAMKPTYPDAPKEIVSTQAVLDEVAIANKHNERGVFFANDAKVRTERIETAGRTLAGLKTDAADVESQISKLQVKLRELQGRISEGDAYIGRENTALEAANKEQADFKPVDLAPLQTKLATIEDTNKKVRANTDKATAVADARTKETESETLTERITAIDEEKAEMLRTAKFPIAGMSIDGDDVTINGVPLAQESDMRRLAIGVEMAAVMNPDKPLILVRHGNLFTPQNFGILEEIAKKRNLTCIVEIPGVGVAGSKLVFEDGVGSTPAAAPAAPESTEQLPLG